MRLSTVTDDTPAVQWDLVDLVPPDLVDPFADDEDPGLDDGQGEDPGLPDGGLPFGAWLAVQAAYFRSQDGTAADWLARKIDELASLAELLGAATPDELDARAEVLDDDRDARLRAEGYDQAMGGIPCF